MVRTLTLNSAELLNGNNNGNNGINLVLFLLATKRIAVDGGTNAWYALKTENCQLLPPHYVSGDFDSIEPSVLEHVRTLEAVKVIHTPDQDETDFTKALRILRDDPEVS